ncbi:MAG: hypothetical protein GQE15_26490 [Archangiaceae bacterium]|nr:hypothetical protein [Archangiaceae bacterium]
MRTALLVSAVLISACFAPVDEGRDGGGSGGGSAVGGGSAGGASAGGMTAGGAGGGNLAGGRSGGGGAVGGGGVGGGRGGGAAGGGTASCRTDAQCGSGELCYDCGSFSACAEGCSPTKPCPRGAQCVGLTQVCLTCPCPQTHCEAPACVDLDGDGYLPQQCQGIPGGDCAPFDPTIHPGAVENCSNGRDDNCNGLVDAADPVCNRTCGPAPACATALDCNLGTTFCGTGNCCSSCPVLSPPLCMAGSCLSPPAPNPESGCMLDVRCVPCGTCPAVVAPVCAQLSRGDARTFQNRCQATSAGATVIHDGSCIRGEGLSCTSIGPGCAAGTYCRDACPECDANLFRCTKIGACVNDLDCPAGGPELPPLPCPGGMPAPTRCVNNACVRSCGP